MRNNNSVYDITLDEAQKVLREDFTDLISQCKDMDDIRLLISEEMAKQVPDFIRIVALGLIGEVISG